jgi:hypothetical protein
LIPKFFRRILNFSFGHPSGRIVFPGFSNDPLEFRLFCLPLPYRQPSFAEGCSRFNIFLFCTSFNSPINTPARKMAKSALRRRRGTRKSSGSCVSNQGCLQVTLGACVLMVMGLAGGILMGLLAFSETKSGLSLRKPMEPILSVNRQQSAQIKDEVNHARTNKIS